MLALFLVVAGGLAGLVYYISPAELVRAELVREVKAATGRDLTIGGVPSLTFYPSVGVSLPDVALSPPPGMSGSPTIRSQRINVSVAVWPLIEGKVVVERIDLTKPIVDLRVDGKGRRSWEFAALTSHTRVASLPTLIGAAAGEGRSRSDAMPVAMLAALPGGGLAALDALELRSIRLSDGLVQYLDERSGSGEVVSSVDLTIKGRRISDPMTMNGGLVWNGQRIRLDARLETLRALLHQEPARATVNVDGALAKASFNGKVTLAGAALVEGQTKLDAASLAGLARWLGTELPNGGPLGGLTVGGVLKASPAEVALSGAAIKLGETKADGAVAASFAGARPLIRANLKVSALDIDKLSTHLQGLRTIQRTQPRPLPAAAAQTPPRSIEDILRGTKTDNGGAGRFSPQVRGYTQTKGWSTEKIDGGALRLVDADAQLLIAGLKVGGLSIGKTAVRTTLNNGSARADISDILMYGGRGRGVVTARGEPAGIRIGLNVSVDGVSAQPLLKDAADIEMIAGNGRLTAALGGKGSSQQEIASSLAGRASFVFTDGAIIGWNIPQMLRGLERGRIDNFQKVGTEKTDFSELSANFKVSRGVANTQDLRMNSPLLRLAGSGNTDIGRQQLDMILRPKLVASLSGQGGERDVAGLEIPVRVKGAWDNPQITPDLNGVLKNPETVVNTVNELSKKLKGKKAGEVIRGLIKGNKDAEEAAGQFLKKLFKN